jgi:hypothetical protein
MWGLRHFWRLECYLIQTMEAARRQKEGPRRAL